MVILNTLAGAVATDEDKMHAAASLGASRLQALYSVVLPSTVPQIVTGARLAMGNSFLTFDSAEIVAADKSLGVLIWTSRQLRSDRLDLRRIITLGVLRSVFDRVLRVAVRPLARYKAKI